jgi:hypothetical protein
MRSGRALARTSGVTPDNGRCRMSSLTDRRACRVAAQERDGDCGRPRRFNLYEKCYNSQSPSAPRQERIPVYILNLHPAPVNLRGRDASLQARDARRSACAAPVFQHALASRQGISDCEQSHCPLLILSQKGVDSQRAPFHHEEVAMSKRTFLAPGVVLGDWWHRTADGRLQCDLCPRVARCVRVSTGFASCARRVRRGLC